MENSHNIKSATKLSSTNCLGVSWDKVNCKYVARIRHDGKYKNLGRFTDMAEAQAAYLDAKRQWHPFFNEERLT